jgi:hypothetical protein
LVGLSLSITGSAYAWDYTVSYSGNTVIVNVSGMDNNKTQETCAGASMDDPSGGGAHCGIPGSSFDTVSVTCNRLGAHVLYVEVFDSTTGGTYEVRQTAVNISTPPPPSCPQYLFGAKGSTVLTHKYGPEDYPPGQERDAQLDLIFRPIQVDAGTAIYLRVVDAKDSSTYRTNAPATNDNLDSAGGTIAASPSDTGSRTFTFSAGSDPVTTLYLNTTGFGGGDNYKVQISANPSLASDPNFVCELATACQEAGPITVWKRVYLEKHEMYRSGVFVVGTAAAGSNQVLVQVPDRLSWSNVALRAGDSITLMHAPRLDGLDLVAATFYEEDAVITAVDTVGVRSRRLLTLAAPLAHMYIEDTSYPDAVTFGVDDGVGNNGAGLYQRNEAYLNNAFAPAFVQIYPVDSQATTEIPYLPVIRRPVHVANKWFENSTVNLATWGRPGHENVKHVLTGSGAPDTTTTKLVVSADEFGETGIDRSPPPNAGYLPDENFSWTYLGGIERAVGTHGQYRNLSAVTWGGENLVHELAHTFNVNSIFYFGTDYGHCTKAMAGTPSQNCRMHSSQDPAFVPGQVADGIVGFHYAAEDDSEYMTMRRALEPLATPVR